MKNIFLTSVFLLSSFWLLACDYTLVLTDSYGDGWDNADIEVHINGILQNTYTIDNGYSSTVTITVNNGNNLKLYYTSGSYEDEHEWNLYNSDGILVASDGPTPSTGWVLDISADCGSQNDTITAGDCSSAINICTDLGFQIDANGFGSVNEIPALGSLGNPDNNNPGGSGNMGCLRVGENNSTWMIINIASDGNLEFNFGGASQAGYYDWIMYPYNATSCNDIKNNLVAPVRCNWNSASSGGTGLDDTPTGTQDAGNFEPALPVQCGEQYIICFSNYSASLTSVPLVFGGTAVVECGEMTCAGTPCSATIGNPDYQDCIGAIPVNQNEFCQANSFSGVGAIPNEINSGPSCLNSGEKNDVWYVFTTQNSGSLSFLITPNELTDDYDFAVYNLTDKNCTEIYNNSSLEVSCNYSGIAGNTGANGAVGEQYESVIPVLNGEVYVLNISNFSSSQDGYNLSFAGTTSIVDTFPPNLMLEQDFMIFGTSILPIIFNEDIQALIINSADFTLTGPGGPYNISIGSTGSKSLGAKYSKSINLNISPAINDTGLYVLDFTNSNASLKDIYGNLALPQSFQFRTYEIPTSISTTNATCLGINDGSATVTPSGTTSPFTYLWSNGVTDSTIFNVTAGTYYVTTTDSNLVSKVDTVLISGTIVVSTTINSSNPTCFGATNGTADISASSGTSPYNYIWSTSETTSNIDNLGDGTYYVTVNDTNGCYAIDSVTINQPNQIISNLSATICEGDSLNFGTQILTSTGIYEDTLLSQNGCDSLITLELAVNPITSSTTSETSCTPYIWTDGNTYTNSGTYTQTLTNSAGCDSVATLELSINNSTSSTTNVTTCNSFTWSDGNTYTISGTYSQTLTNSAGCDSVATLELTINVSTSSSASVTTCDSFTWTDGNTYTNSGTYTQTLTSSAGCDSIATLELTINNSISTTTETSCTPYTWTDGNTYINSGTYTQTLVNTVGCDSIIILNLTIPLNYDIDTTISICAGDSLILGTQLLNTTGIYTDTLTSLFGCDSIVSINLIVNPTPITSISIINSTCSGFSNGVAEVTVSGGTSPYSYNWSNGQTTLQIVNLSAGIYYITVTDINGCFVIDSATINQPDEIIPNITVGNVTCYGGSDGYCTISSSGGTAPYSYYWSNGINDDVISNLTIGTYNVTITDANNCIVSDTAIITQPLQIYISGSVTNSTGSNGAIDITVINGISPYTFLWSNAAVTEDISGLAIGNYSVTVTDSIGCTRLKTFTVNFDCSGLNVNLSATNCTSNQISDGSIYATVSGGTTPYIYNWTNGSNYTNIENLSVGQYCITVTDFNNCQKIKCANINADTIFGNYYINSSTTVEVCISAIHTFVSDLGFYLLAPGFGHEQLNDTVTGQAGIVELLPTVSNWQTVTQLPISVISCTTFDINTNCNSGNNVTDFCFTTTLSAGNPSYTACVCDLPTPLTGDYASAGPWSTVYGFPIDVGGWSVMITDCEAIDVGAYSNITLKFVQGTNQYFYNSGSISLEITDNTCISQSTNIYTFALLPVSVNLPSIENNNILIYPNPATDEVFVENSKPQISNSKFQEKMEYRIYSIEGRKVKEGNLEAPKTRISTKDLESGVYFIEVNIGNEKVNSKLVITK